jgi:hypothetical protein
VNAISAEAYRRSCAYHEAGHCLAELCGLPVAKATVVPSQGFDGLVYYGAPTHVGLQARTRAYGIAALLGPCAEAQFTGERVRDVLDRCDGDLKEARRSATIIALGRATWAADARVGVFHELLNEARQLVSEHWHVILEVASALEYGRTLNGAQIARLVHFANKKGSNHEQQLAR